MIDIMTVLRSVPMDIGGLGVKTWECPWCKTQNTKRIEENNNCTQCGGPANKMPKGKPSDKTFPNYPRKAVL